MCAADGPCDQDLSHLVPEKENFGQKFLIIRIDFSEYFCFWQNSGFFSDVQFFLLTTFYF